MAVLAGIIQSMLHKDIPEPADGTPYMGTSIAVLALREGSDAVKADASHVMLAMATLRRYRMELVDLGAIEVLVELLPSHDQCTRLNVIRALQQLSLEKRAHPTFQCSKTVAALLCHLKSAVCGDAEAAESLRVLQCLMVSPWMRLQFVQLDGIATMADFIFSGSEAQRDRAVFVLWILAAIPAFQVEFVTSKAIAALVFAMDHGHGDLIDTSLSAMALLAENGDCREALVAQDVLAMLPRVVDMEAREEVAFRVELLEELLLTLTRP